MWWLAFWAAIVIGLDARTPMELRAICLFVALMAPIKIVQWWRAAR